MSRRIPAQFLGAGAVVAYREAGWHISEGGRPDTGVVTGPCARCPATTIVYGPYGNPCCPTCRKPAPPESAPPPAEARTGESAPVDQPTTA